MIQAWPPFTRLPEAAGARGLVVTRRPEGFFAGPLSTEAFVRGFLREGLAASLPFLRVTVTSPLAGSASTKTTHPFWSTVILDGIRPPLPQCRYRFLCLISYLIAKYQDLSPTFFAASVAATLTTFFPFEIFGEL